MLGRGIPGGAARFLHFIGETITEAAVAVAVAAAATTEEEEEEEEASGNRGMDARMDAGRGALAGDEEEEVRGIELDCD